MFGQFFAVPPLTSMPLRAGHGLPEACFWAGPYNIQDQKVVIANIANFQKISILAPDLEFLKLVQNQVFE